MPVSVINPAITAATPVTCRAAPSAREAAMVTSTDISILLPAWVTEQQPVASIMAAAREHRADDEFDE